MDCYVGWVEFVEGNVFEWIVGVVGDDVVVEVWIGGVGVLVVLVGELYY